MWIIRAVHNETEKEIIRQEWTKTAADIIAKVYEDSGYTVTVEWSQR